MAKSSKELNEELNKAIEDARSLLKRVADEGEEGAEELRSQAKQILNKAVGSISDAGDSVVQNGKQAARVADDYVHENPWATTGVAAVAGILLGVIIARR